MVFPILTFLTNALFLTSTSAQKYPRERNCENDHFKINHLDIYDQAVENLLMTEVTCTKKEDNGDYRYSTDFGAAYLLPNSRYIITANHNLDNQNEPNCELKILQYRLNRYIPFSIVYQNKEVDFAILITDQNGKNNTQLRNSTDLVPTDSIFVIGHALGKRKPTITLGYMITYPETYELWYSNPTSSGDSGGVILDLKGKILGIHIGRNLNVAIGVPIDFIKPELFAREIALSSFYDFLEISRKIQLGNNTLLYRHYKIQSIIDIPESVCEKLKLSMGYKECGVMIIEAPLALKLSMILEINNQRTRNINQLTDECDQTEEFIKRKDVSTFFSMITKRQLGTSYTTHELRFHPKL